MREALLLEITSLSAGNHVVVIEATEKIRNQLAEAKKNSGIITSVLNEPEFKQLMQDGICEQTFSGIDLANLMYFAGAGTLLPCVATVDGRPVDLERFIKANTPPKSWHDMGRVVLTEPVLVADPCTNETAALITGVVIENLHHGLWRAELCQELTGWTRFGGKINAELLVYYEAFLQKMGIDKIREKFSNTGRDVISDSHQIGIFRRSQQEEVRKQPIFGEIRRLTRSKLMCGRYENIGWFSRVSGNNSHKVLTAENENKEIIAICIQVL